MSAGPSLTLLQLRLDWPAELPISALREWLRCQLSQHGEALRWAITAVEPLPDGGSFRKLQLEAVVTKPDVLIPANPLIKQHLGDQIDQIGSMRGMG